MPKSSRRSGESGTASGSDPFSRARTQLTLFYLAIIVVIVAVLSAAVYAVHMNDLRRSIHERLERMEVRGNRERFEDSLTDYTDDLRRAIIFGDLATVIGVGGLSYLLAGRTQRPIRLAMDAQKRFLTDAAHDLRTPLAVMRTEAEVALERKDLTRDEAVQVIGSQLEEISRLSLMVDQILTLMRGAEVERRARGPVPLAQVAASVVQKLGGLAARRGVRLDFAGRSDGVVRGDRVALERALVNVVENALVYTPSGGSVRVEVGRSGGRVEVRTRDTGIGIAPDDLPHVTEPFFRADPARTAHESGAGLGLTIVAEIAREHQGVVHVASEPGRGTTVTLRFPAA